MIFILVSSNGLLQMARKIRIGTSKDSIPAYNKSPLVGGDFCLLLFLFALFEELADLLLHASGDGDAA